MRIFFKKIGGTTYYDTLAAAIDNASNGDTVVLFKDLTVDSEITIPSGKKITLDFNGKTITYTKADGARLFQIYGEMIVNNGSLNSREKNEGGVIVSYNNNLGVFDIQENGRLTINGGYYTQPGKGAGAVIRGRKNSTVVINNGSFVATEYDCALNCEGNATINDGFFDSLSNNSSGKWAYCIGMYNHFKDTNVKPKLIINGGTVQGVQGAISIVAGTFEINNVTASAKEIAGKTTDKSYFALYVAAEHDAVSGVVNGGTFNAQTREALRVGRDNSDAVFGNVSVEVNGGVFIGNEQDVKFTAQQTQYSNTLTFKGGKFAHNKVDDTKDSKEKMLSDYLASGYSVSDSPIDGYYDISAK